MADTKQGHFALLIYGPCLITILYCQVLARQEGKKIFSVTKRCTRKARRHETRSVITLWGGSVPQEWQNNKPQGAAFHKAGHPHASRAPPCNDDEELCDETKCEKVTWTTILAHSYAKVRYKTYNAADIIEGWKFSSNLYPSSITFPANKSCFVWVFIAVATIHFGQRCCLLSPS